MTPTEDKIETLAQVKGEEGVLNAIMETALGRRLFISSEGRIGTATNDVREGDIICFMIGCGYTVVLREREGGEGFVFVGEAWLDGMKCRDAVEGFRAGRYEPQIFRIW